jgi:hypothetical protein
MHVGAWSGRDLCMVHLLLDLLGLVVILRRDRLGFEPLELRELHAHAAQLLDAHLEPLRLRMYVTPTSSEAVAVAVRRVAVAVRQSAVAIRRSAVAVRGRQRVGSSGSEASAAGQQQRPTQPTQPTQQPRWPMGGSGAEETSSKSSAC